MVTKKSAALNIRISTNVKEAIRIAADREHRSVANMIEILIREHCERVGVSIPEQKDMLDGEE